MDVRVGKQLVRDITADNVDLLIVFSTHSEAICTVPCNGVLVVYCCKLEGIISRLRCVFRRCYCSRRLGKR